jgi:glucose-1-phosphate cytidylyltransferase
MKVVVFCGGLGVRMGEATQTIPKPMIRVGARPILWHIMKWYASWGHTDFVLCLGHQAESIKEYFLNYSEALANDFVLRGGNRPEVRARGGNRPEVELLGSDTDDWSITFVDTGLNSTLGERLKAVEKHLEGESMFFATYGDGLTDAPLDRMVKSLESSGKTGMFISVRPPVEYHVVRVDGDGLVQSVEPLADSDVWINGGYFIFRREIFDAIKPGEDLVHEPFARLIERGDLLAYKYEGFWEAMDTIKDKQRLDALLESGRVPWMRRASSRK